MPRKRYYSSLLADLENAPNPDESNYRSMRRLDADSDDARTSSRYERMAVAHNPWSGFWASVKSFFQSVWDWCVDLFTYEADPEKEYKQTRKRLERHIRRYITSEKPIDCNAVFDADAKKLAAKQNTALSLLYCLRPNAKVFGKPISMTRDNTLIHQKGFLSKTWTQLRADEEKLNFQKDNPITAWYRKHQVDDEHNPVFDVDYLNYHRTAYGRFFHDLFGWETKTTKLLKQAMELEKEVDESKLTYSPLARMLKR